MGMRKSFCKEDGDAGGSDGVRAELGGKASPVIGAWTVGSIFCDPVGDIHTFYRGLGKGPLSTLGFQGELDFDEVCKLALLFMKVMLAMKTSTTGKFLRC
ncbi:hypothetical protein CEXT_628341 [Caerostris extrusa]|uniref:Uncharacterized protein n=1 Tax=Caerostris extrusa TaxID=172846 RepID=A0AAV4W5T1_CAEEX|nr:hypothetical protein CEXT_628341 [Caerostris extrusa]